jgi:hypothetical protein
VIAILDGLVSNLKIILLRIGKRAKKFACGMMDKLFGIFSADLGLSFRNKFGIMKLRPLWVSFGLFIRTASI